MYECRPMHVFSSFCFVFYIFSSFFTLSRSILFSINSFPGCSKSIGRISIFNAREEEKKKFTKAVYFLSIPYK